MLKKLPEVNPKEWSDEACDPGTGFPRWRYVREHGTEWQNMKEQMTAEQLTQHEAEKLARKIGGLLEKATPDAGRLALNMLATEEKLAIDDPDTKAFMADIADPEAIF
ncbi:hypothetical protein [Oleiagrimonas sp. C23AA]|uniref:hypothetical protein n=1 Tax=Oleiagrimonas sp. C23AA TaxID=2719047 RepID=UPI001F109176|nr:hypothetical protein [Oleiagrimonas sp. C23AA]